MRDPGYVGAVLLAALMAHSSAAGQLPAGSTRIVNVNGHPTRVLELGVEERGANDPVLVLFSGAGSPLETWGGWPSEVSDLAPVVAYDRPGIGQSEYDGLEASPAHLVEHAHAVLDALGVPPPYILVGHSWGGPLALYFVGRYPDEVVGLVYLDPTDPRESRCETVMATDDEECAARWAEAEASTAGLSLPAGQRAELDGISAWQDTPVAERRVPRDPDVPTGVLLGTLAPSGGGGPSYIDATFWAGYLERRVTRFAERVRNLESSTLIIATDAGHFVHRADPALATEVTRRVLAAVRQR